MHLSAPANAATSTPESTGTEPRRDVFRLALTASLAVLCVVLGALAIYALRGLLVNVVIAAFIAMSLDPAVRWLIAKGLKRSSAVAVVMLTVVLAIAGFCYATIPSLMSEGGKLGTDFPGFVNTLRQRSPSLRHLEDRFGWQPKIDAFAHQAPAWLSHHSLAFGTRFFGALVTALLVVVVAVYFMADLPRLRRGIVRLFPKRYRPQATHAAAVIVEKVGSYMIGNIIVSLIAGVTALIAMLILGVPYALPLAVAVAITDLIPLVGATIGAALCVLVAFATTDLWPATIMLALFFLLYQQVENYFVAPRVLRNAVELSSVAVLLVAVAGGTVLGVAGALMAVPIAAAIRVVVAPMLVARDEADEAVLAAEAAEAAEVDEADEAVPRQAASLPNRSFHGTSADSI